MYTLEEADRPPSILSAFFILERQSEFVLVVVLPGYDSVALPRELLQAKDEASMKEFLFRCRVMMVHEASSPSTCSLAPVCTLGTLCIVSLASDHATHDLVNADVII